MRCQQCGSGNLTETRVNIPIATPKGKLIIGDVPAVKCLKCGKEFMSVVSNSRVKEIYKDWESSDEQGDKIIKYSLLKKR